MNKQLLFFTFSSFLLLFWRCSSPETYKNPTPIGTMQAKVDNGSWAANKVSATINGGANNFLTIVGTNGNSNEIVLSVDGVTGTGTFTSSPSKVVTGKFESRANAEYWISTFGGSCTVTITKFDQGTQLLSGTFDFTGENLDGTSSKTISGGIFTDISYSVY